MSKRIRNQGPIRLGSIMNDVLSSCGLSERVAERALLAAWPQIAGARLAAHVQAVDLREGVLFLATEHGAWKQEVSLLLPRIRSECNRLFGAESVREIRWVRAWTGDPTADNDKRRNR